MNTPGPWTRSREHLIDWQIPISQFAHGKLICGVYHPDDPTDPDQEAVANAMLIMQAPALLDALIKARGLIADDVDSGVLDSSFLDEIDLVLDRATNLMLWEDE